MVDGCRNESVYDRFESIGDLPFTEKMPTPDGGRVLQWSCDWCFNNTKNMRPASILNAGDYSARNAIIGSVVVALRAGR